MKNYKHFLNEGCDEELEDDGISKDEKREQKETQEEKERLAKIELHDKEVQEISEKSEGRIIKKIKFDIDIRSTDHAIDRLNRKDKEGKSAYEPIDFKEVNSVISRATEEMISELVKDEMDINKDRFILQRKTDGLTVVGIMEYRKDLLYFVVITLFRGEDFRTGPNQKIIKV